MTELTRQDFVSDQEVRWCPGCGDYAVLASMQKVLPTLGVPKENIVFVSGIGCAGRFPYYVDTYGFHTIHGRAPAVATGLKLMRPELSVWVVTGDGDGLSIGGNHLLHALRRNIDINILLFNNQIYGLTKGQYSPTSRLGQQTPTSPVGVIDKAVNPIAFAIAAGASFVARAIDVDAKGLQAVLQAASAHRGVSIIEILQNCHIYNDGAFSAFAEKPVRADNTVSVVHGQPYQYGKQADKCLSDFPEVHDETNRDLAWRLAHLSHPDTPVPLGVLLREQRPVWEAEKQCSAPAETSVLSQLLREGQVWYA